jgi:hypothetical protein
MPTRIKYWYIGGKTPIKANGAAQQNPFTTFAAMGHLRLFFILARTEENTPWDFRKINPNVRPKLTNHIITYSYAGYGYLTITSLRSVPITTAIETPIKSKPKALLVSSS